MLPPGAQKGQIRLNEGFCGASLGLIVVLGGGMCGGRLGLHRLWAAEARSQASEPYTKWGG